MKKAKKEWLRKRNKEQSPDHPVSHPKVSRVKQPVPEVNHSPQSSVEVMNVWRYTSTLPYVFMAYFLLVQEKL
jgi:hypothetical protein